jgi:hypothetical protein
MVAVRGALQLAPRGKLGSNSFSANGARKSVKSKITTVGEQTLPIRVFVFTHFLE